MGLRDEVDNIYQWNRQVAFRPAQAIAATPTNLFAIQGGVVKITSIVAHLVTAITTAVTWHMTAGAVALDTALFAAIGAAGTVVTWPLDVGAALIAPAAVAPVPSILGAAFNVNGIAVVPSNLILTYAVALIDGNVAFSVEYYRLNPAANIVPL